MLSSLFACLKSLIIRETEQQNENNIEEKKENENNIEEKKENEAEESLKGILMIHGDEKDELILDQQQLASIAAAISTALNMGGSKEKEEYRQKRAAMTDDEIKEKLTGITDGEKLQIFKTILPTLTGDQLFDVWSACDLLSRRKFGLKFQVLPKLDMYKSTKMENNQPMDSILLPKPGSNREPLVDIYYDEQEFYSIYKKGQQRPGTGQNIRVYDGSVISSGEKVIFRQIMDDGSDVPLAYSSYNRELGEIPKVVSRSIDSSYQFEQTRLIQKTIAMCQNVDEYMLVCDYYDFTLSKFMEKYKGDDPALNVFFTENILKMIQSVHTLGQTNREVNVQNIGINVQREEFIMINPGSFRQERDLSKPTSTWELNDDVSQSPEQFNHRYCDEKVDIWSTGIVAMSILTNLQTLYHQIMNNPLRFVNINGVVYAYPDIEELKKNVFYALLSEMNYCGHPKYENMEKDNAELLKLIFTRMLRYDFKKRGTASDILKEDIFQNSYSRKIAFELIVNIYNGNIQKKTIIKRDENTNSSTKPTKSRKRAFENIEDTDPARNTNLNDELPPKKRRKLQSPSDID